MSSKPTRQEIDNMLITLTLIARSGTEGARAIREHRKRILDQLFPEPPATRDISGFVDYLVEPNERPLTAPSKQPSAYSVRIEWEGGGTYTFVVSGVKPLVSGDLMMLDVSTATVAIYRKDDLHHPGNRY